MKNYKSVVEGRWHKNATVRVRPRPILPIAPLEDRPFDYYSRVLVPAASHPILLLQPPDAQSALLIHHNYAFSRATSKLETEILNPTLLHLAEGFEHLALPADLRFDARHIFVDESYHALIAEDSIRQIEAKTGVVLLQCLTPPAFDEIGHAAAEFGPDSYPLVRFLFCFVLETLVSDTFTLLPDDPTVHPFVRDAIGQHRQDEQVHHEFFREAFRFVWPALSPREKSIGVQVIPRFINSILGADDSQLALILWAIGLNPTEVAKVLADSYAASVLSGNPRQAAERTLRYCRKAGVLRSEEAQRIFKQARLID
jgi:P-aminobenzoate N-oxygenase AurF